ncbi:hypothetical protein AVEN_139366-1 [Araneus ventricosus]|uniref:Uncharacterized protein n=1 Tax=Araneus ventricosus TaxID=182803 RepID=A0A4Y2EB60_ARAVE|nr:hypothetical protein AVEN_139366-1 [Araneus ventricosus]
MPFALRQVFSPILIEKYRYAIHKDANSEQRWEELSSFSLYNCLSIALPQSADFYFMLPSKRGFNLRKALFFTLASFRVPLKRNFKLQGLRSDFSPDGIPTTTSHLADFHRFLWLFPSRVQNIQFICEVNGWLNTHCRFCVSYRSIEMKIQFGPWADSC